MPYLNFIAPYLSIFIDLSSLVFKLFLLKILCENFHLTKKDGLLYLAIVFITAAFTDLGYMVWGLYILFFKLAGFKPWAMASLHLVFIVKTAHFYALLFFFKNLSSKTVSSKYLKPLIAGVVLFSFFFTYKAIYIIFTGVTKYSNLDWAMTKAHAAFYLFLAILSLLLLYRNYRVERLNLLKKHILSITLYFMAPYFVVNVFNSDFVFHKTNLLMVSLLSCLFTLILYYCLKKLVPLRFMNIRNHVESIVSKKFSFPRDFIGVINNFGLASKPEELRKITKEFFNKAFNIPENKVELCIRYLQDRSACCKNAISRVLYVEKAFNSEADHSKVASFSRINKILIKNELEFTYFYESKSGSTKTSELGAVVEFLDKIKAVVFLPIYNCGRLSAYVTVEIGARADKPFSDIERDEMVIYGTYLSSVLHLFSSMDVEKRLKDEHKMKLDLHAKNRIVELMEKSFAYVKKVDHWGKIGILTYKDRKFTYCNKAAKEILRLDLNNEKGLGITSKIYETVLEVTKTSGRRKKIITGAKGEMITVTVAQNMERNNVLITVSSPTTADLIQDHIENLKDQSKWFYLIALHTTEEGKVVEHLIPANTPALLNCKIAFFEAAALKRFFLLELHSEEDAVLFAQAAQRINKRRLFEEVTVNKMSGEIFAKKVFGVNAMFRGCNEKCLLERLSNSGVLLIKNVHLLSLDLQKKLFEFVTTGKFRPMHSDERIASKAFIVCSSDKSLFVAVQNGSFSRELYLELRKNSLFLPSLSDLPEEEVLELSEGFRKQVIYNELYHNLLVLTEADKRKIVEARCASLSDLKSKVKNIVLKKSVKQDMQMQQVVDPACDVSDPELAEAVRLGKTVLKDPDMLKSIMEKFQYSQSRVADFLSVNRSSVSRRCQEFNIQDHPDEKKPPAS